MAGRRRVGKEPKGDEGEYSTIGVKNIICNNSREIKDITKNIPGLINLGILSGNASSIFSQLSSLVPG